MAGSRPKSSIFRDYQVGDIVLARVKGYPFWPCKVYKKWTGKKEVWWGVWFFPEGDYIYARPSEMMPLTRTMIHDHLNKNKNSPKSALLNEGYRIALDPRDWEAARQAPTGTRADDDEDEAGEKEDEQEQNYHRRHAAYDQTASGSRSTSSMSTAKSSDHPRPTGSTHAHPGSSTKMVKRRLDSDRENDDGESEYEEEDRQQPGVMYSAPQRKKKKRVLKTFRGVDSQQLAQASQVGAHGRSSNGNAVASSSRPLQEGVHKTGGVMTYTTKAKPKPHPPSADERPDPADAENLKEAREMRNWFQRMLLDKDPEIGDMWHAHTRLVKLEAWDMTDTQVKSTKIGKVFRIISNRAASGDLVIPGGDKFNIQQRTSKLTEQWSALIARGAMYGSDVSPFSSVPSSIGQRAVLNGHGPPPSYDATMQAAEEERFRPAGRTPARDVEQRVGDEEESEIEVVRAQQRELSPEPPEWEMSQVLGDLIVESTFPGSEPFRYSSDLLANSPSLHDRAADPECPRDFEDTERPGELLKTLKIELSNTDVHLLLRFLVGGEATKGVWALDDLKKVAAMSGAFDAPPVRETVILAALKRLETRPTRLVDTFALGCVLQSARLVEASLMKLDREPLARERHLSKVGSKTKERLQDIKDDDMFLGLTIGQIRKFYKWEKLVDEGKKTWYQLATENKFLAKEDPFP